MRLLLLLLLNAAPWLAAPPVPAATVLRGRVLLPATGGSDGLTATRYPGRSNSLPVTDELVRGAAPDAVIYVESLPDSVTVPAPSGKAPRLEQENQRFKPRLLVIQSGTTVEFPNRDPIYHNVFSVSPTKRFDLGKYVQGQSRSVRFEKSGLVHVFCDIHSDMAAFIVVVPHHVFARADAQGQFALPALPDGTYELHAWHPDFGERRLVVTVNGEAPGPIEIRF